MASFQSDKDLHRRGKDWPGAETNSSKKGPAGAALSSTLFFFFFPLSFLLHGNRVGVKEMCKHTLVLSTSLSARLNRSHKNMFCTSRTCRRLMLSAACQQKQTLETGLGYHNPPWVPWGRASSAPITLKPPAVGFCTFFFAGATLLCVDRHISQGMRDNGKQLQTATR